jgi:hypothetical protein
MGIVPSFVIPEIISPCIIVGVNGMGVSQTPHLSTCLPRPKESHLHA